MAVLALTDAFIYVDGYEFSGDSNNLQLNMEAAALNSTTFGSSWATHVGGVKTSVFDLAGFWQSAAADAVDPQVFPNLATANRVHTVGLDETETSVVYMWRAGQFTYQIGGPHGEIAPFSCQSRGTDGVGVVRGQLAKERGNVNVTGVLGSVVELGAPSATQYVYTAVHIFTAGTTVTLQLQSDTAAGFSTPTTQATIGALTTTGGTWMTRLAGPFAGETHWRLNISAITGTFNIAAAIAVQ